MSNPEEMTPQQALNIAFELLDRMTTFVMGIDVRLRGTMDNKDHLELFAHLQAFRKYRKAWVPPIKSLHDDFLKEDPT